jgi:hypothetical protein
MRLDSFFAKYLRGKVTTLPTRPLTIGSDTSLLGTNKPKATQLFKKMKTDVHMTEHRQDKSHHFHWSNTARHRWGECNITVWEDEDRRTLMRRKWFSSSAHHVYIQRSDGVVMTGFQQYKRHLSAFHPQHIIYFTEASNTPHEDTTIITCSLIESFL